MINNCIFEIYEMGDWENYEEKKNICKDHYLQKMISISFLTYKASNVKMFSRWSSVSQHCTFMAPLLSRALCCGAWGTSSCFFCGFCLEPAQKRWGFITDRAVRALGIKCSLLNYSGGKSQASTFQLNLKSIREYFNPQFLV